MNLELDYLFCRLSFLGIFDREGSASGGEILAVLPCLENIRWLLPVSKRQVFHSSLSIYQPSSLKAKIAKSMISLTGRISAQKLWFGNKMMFWKQDDLVANILGDSRLEYAVFTGTPGIHRKAVVQVMDADGLIRGYIKVGLARASEDLIENEHRVLLQFEKEKICEGQIPLPIYFGSGTGSKILMINTNKTERSRWYRSMREGHVEFLIRLLLNTAVEEIFGDSVFFGKIGGQIERLSEWVPFQWSDRFHRAWSRVLSILADRSLPMGFCHRDFTFWNTYWERDRLYVFDWEYAAPNYPPLLDLFHFLVKDCIFIRHDKPYQILKRLKAQENWIKRYMKETQVCLDCIEALLLCYLIDILVLNIAEKNDCDGSLDRWPLNVWAEMIDLILKEK